MQYSSYLSKFYIFLYFVASEFAVSSLKKLWFYSWICIIVMLYFPPFFSYEFKVKPRNELGSGPPSEPVTFNTESGTFLPVFRECTSQSSCSQTETPGPLRDFKCFKQQVEMLQTFHSSVKTNVHPQRQLLFLPISNSLSRNCNSLQMYN